MGISLSGGDYQYNRFDAYEKELEQIDEVSKELATKAYAERRTNEVEGDELHTKSDKTRKRIVKKHGEKAGKDADKAVDKKLYGESISVTKDDVLEFMLENSLANNVVSAEVLFNHISDEFLESIEEDIMEIYKGKHGQSEKQYQDGRSPAGKMISGDSKGSGANYSYGAKNTGSNPAGGSQKPQGQAKMNNKDRTFLAHQKANKNSNK